MVEASSESATVSSDESKGSIYVGKLLSQAPKSVLMVRPGAMGEVRPAVAIV